MGAIDGLSVGYRVDAKGYHYDERGKKAYAQRSRPYGNQCSYLSNEPKARISAVKAEDRSVRDWETFLRDEGGCLVQNQKWRQTPFQRL